MSRKTFFIIMGLYVFVVGFLDLVASGLSMNQKPITFTNSSVLIYIFEANVVFLCALAVGIYLLKQKDIAKWAAIALSLVYFSFLIVKLYQNGEMLLTHEPVVYYLKAFVILPMLLILPAVMIASSLLASRAAKSEEPSDVLLPSPEVTPAEPKH